MQVKISPLSRLLPLLSKRRQHALEMEPENNPKYPKIFLLSKKAQTKPNKSTAPASSSSQNTTLQSIKDQTENKLQKSKFGTVKKQPNFTAQNNHQPSKREGGRHPETPPDWLKPKIYKD